MFNSRKSPSAGIKNCGQRKEDAAHPDDEEENSCASLGHSRFQGTDDGNIPEKLIFVSCIFKKLVLN